jgi:hypothetical protein
MQNFINEDYDGTGNSVGTCKFPEGGIDDANTCRSKLTKEINLE